MIWFVWIGGVEELYNNKITDGAYTLFETVALQRETSNVIDSGLKHGSILIWGMTASTRAPNRIMIDTPYQVYSTTLVFHHFWITSFSLFAIDFSQKIIANDRIIFRCLKSRLRWYLRVIQKNSGHNINRQSNQRFIFVYYLSLAASSNRIAVKAIFTLIEKFLGIVFIILNTTHIQSQIRKYFVNSWIYAIREEILFSKKIE